MADTGALFNATAVTTAGGHANLLTTALAAAEWEVVSNAVYTQPLLIAQETGYYGTGPAMAIDPKFCLVPRELKLTAIKILYPDWENAANVHSENLRSETGYYGTGPAMAIDPKFCLVPRELKLTAIKILYPDWENAANVHSENL